MARRHYWKYWSSFDDLGYSKLGAAIRTSNIGLAAIIGSIGVVLMILGNPSWGAGIHTSYIGLAAIIGSIGVVLRRWAYPSWRAAIRMSNIGHAVIIGSIGILLRTIIFRGLTSMQTVATEGPTVLVQSSSDSYKLEGDRRRRHPQRVCRRFEEEGMVSTINNKRAVCC
jgi:hypothetical protein